MSSVNESQPTEVGKPLKFGQYSVVRLLGQGGMSQIYEGRHPQLGSPVALKVMQPALAAQPMAAARFLREAKAASQIRHENVVQVFDIGIEDGIPFIVMEFLDGADLAKLLSEKGAMPLAGIAEVFLPVLSAVATAHRVGIVHRDLKPSNLMITSRDPRGTHPMVLDFGISKIIGEEVEGALTRSESLLGTVQYMAPELTRGAKFASPASDQYAIGVMLYECATGQRPFTGASYYDLMHAIVTTPVKAPSELLDSLPPEFDELVLRAMHRDPESRFPSIQALGGALLSFAGKTPRAIWEDEFLGMPGGRGEPWTTDASTLNDGLVATSARRRSARRKSARWTRWSFGALTAYAGAATVLLMRHEPTDTRAALAVPMAPEPRIPQAPPLDQPATQAPPAPAATPAGEAVASAIPVPSSPPVEVRKSAPARKTAPPTDRLSAGAAPPSSAAPTAPRPVSTVGTNGAPIVE